MKPIHVGLLIAAAALGGALIVKVTQAPAPEPAPTAAEAPIPATPATAAAEPAALVEEKLPSPFPEKAEPPKPVTRQSPARRSKPAETPVARNTPPVQEPAASPAPAPAPTPAPEPVNETPAVVVNPAPAYIPPPPPPPPRKVTLTVGTVLPARLVDGLSTERNQAGDTFTATLDAPLVVDGLVIAERGAKLEGRVVEAQEAGRVKGVSSLAVALTRLTTSDGQHVAIQTESFTKQGPTSVREDAAKVGAAAGIGAAIGAIAGGGKGAAIGAAVGGAAGTGGVMATRGKPATLSSETRITFHLSQPVTITERQ